VTRDTAAELFEVDGIVYTRSKANNVVRPMIQMFDDSPDDPVDNPDWVFYEGLTTQQLRTDGPYGQTISLSRETVATLQREGLDFRDRLVL
jgi:hypothetical protein